MEEQPGAVDTTHAIFCYENGKTWDCPECGGEMGTELDTRYLSCGWCDAVLVDERAEERRSADHRRDEDGDIIDRDRRYDGDVSGHSADVSGGGDDGCGGGDGAGGDAGEDGRGGDGDGGSEQTTITEDGVDVQDPLDI